MQNTNGYVGTDERDEIPSAEGAAQQLGQILARGLRPLYGRAYRILGSAVDAEDAVQDALLVAYRQYNCQKTMGEINLSLLSSQAISSPGHFLLAGSAVDIFSTLSTPSTVPVLNRPEKNHDSALFSSVSPLVCDLPLRARGCWQFTRSAHFVRKDVLNKQVQSHD